MKSWARISILTVMFALGTAIALRLKNKAYLDGSIDMCTYFVSSTAAQQGLKAKCVLIKNESGYTLAATMLSKQGYYTLVNVITGEIIKEGFIN